MSSNCDKIKWKLCENGLKNTNVYTHEFDGNTYYVLKVSDYSCDKRHIAKALGIQKDDVHFIHNNLQMNYLLYWISKSLLMSKYGKCGQLFFSDFRENWKHDEEAITKHIEPYCEEVTIDNSAELIIIEKFNYKVSIDHLFKELGMKDVGLNCWASTGKTVVINVGRYLEKNDE